MTLEEYKNGKTKTNINNYLVLLVKRVLITCSIVLIILIACNLNKNFKSYVNKYVYQTNYNFSKINSLYKKYLLEIKKDTKEKVKEQTK